MKRDRYERKHRRTHNHPEVLKMEAHTAPLPDVLAEIQKERAYQTAKWGNDFDNANEEKDWAAFIMHYLAVGMTGRLGAAPGRPWREAMLKVATLAVAAVEAHDRKANVDPF